MLNGDGDQSPIPFIMTPSVAERQAAELDLTPDEIVIHVEVDAHFAAD